MASGDSPWKKTGLVIGLVVIGFLVLWGRAFHGSMKAYEEAEALFRASDYVRAVTFFDRSIRWYTPFNPYVDKSAQRLWDIADLAEKEGNTRLALMALRTIRRGFRAAESFYTPGKEWTAKSNSRIEQLLRPGNESPTASENEAAPHTLWSMVLLLGLLGWVGSTIGFILFACKGNGTWRISRAPGLLWGSLALVCFALWLVGMMKA
jgi:hypothetical protein